MEASLHSIELVLQLIDILFLGLLELTHNFFLRVDLPIKQLIFRHYFINLVLEFVILRCQNVYLSRQSLGLNIGILGSKHLIPILSLLIHELSTRNIMLFLFLFISLDPHLPGLLLALQNLIQISDLFLHLLFGLLKRPFDCLLLSFHCLCILLHLRHLLLQIIHFLLLLLQLLILLLNQRLLRPDLLLSLSRFYLEFVASLIRQMLALGRLLQILPELLKLFIDFLKFNLLAAVRDL